MIKSDTMLWGISFNLSIKGNFPVCGPYRTIIQPLYNSKIVPKLAGPKVSIRGSTVVVI